MRHATDKTYVEYRDGTYHIAHTRVTFDFQTAHAAGLLGVSDLDVLARAVLEGRLLATHDFHDVPHPFATVIQEQPSAGVLLVPQRLPIAAVVEDLLLIWSATEGEDWHNGITSLPL